MHYRNEGKRAVRNWRGLPDGSVRTTPACYNCGNYNNSHDQSGKVCCSHNIQAKVIDQLVLETIQYACKSVRMDERAFVESIRSASEIREQSEAKKLKAALKHQEKRYAELDILLKKVYEDNALGRLPAYIIPTTSKHRREISSGEKRDVGKTVGAVSAECLSEVCCVFYSRLTDGMMCSACGEFLNNGCGTA